MSTETVARSGAVQTGRESPLAEGWDLDGREVSTNDPEKPKTPDRMLTTDTLSSAAAAEPPSRSLPQTPHPSPASPTGTRNVAIAMGVDGSGRGKPGSHLRQDSGELLVKKECCNFPRLRALFANCFKCLKEFGKKEN